MGIFAQPMDMNTMVLAAPGRIEQANHLARRAAADQRVSAQAHHGLTAEPMPGNLDPIAGVDLDRYACIIKGIAAYGYDDAKLDVVAARFGVDSTSWALAQSAWADRIRTDRGVGRRFNELYAVA